MKDDPVSTTGEVSKTDRKERFKGVSAHCAFKGAKIHDRATRAPGRPRHLGLLLVIGYGGFR